MKSRLVRSIWRGWEALFRLFAGVHPMLPGEPHLFLLATRRYMGKPFAVDGQEIHRGDRVIELHINNEMVLDLLQEEQKSLIGTTVKLLREAQRSLPILARVVDSPAFQNEHVLYGVTFIHRGVSKLGFETIPLHSSLLERTTTWHLRNIFKIVNPQAEKMLASHPDAFVPKLVAISKERLLQLYLESQQTPSVDPAASDHVLV
ncbi:YkoP family protein [Alicyclobacillus sp. ALC3]|uniref:YkoP family protein n=1 Tax=Alicyclobacillus sp. ALC3 TaxID=2796143 RepID=UPI0023798C84|nr:polysaccharide deacetylase [Alicyclobacillus sp. ALC3]WDL96838.1 polysaccharide deacetylase [Alicyclobacillus sp. ALC3]